MNKALLQLARSMILHELSDGEKVKLRNEIGEQIRDWLPQKGVVSFPAFMEYIRSGCVTLPFSGGWLEQPQWVDDDFTLYRLVLEFHKLNEMLRKDG